MTAFEWLQRLRLMSRCSIVELKPSEAGEIADVIEANVRAVKHLKSAKHNPIRAMLVAERRLQLKTKRKNR